MEFLGLLILLVLAPASLQDDTAPPLPPKTSELHRLELSTEFFLVPERNVPPSPAVVVVTRNPADTSHHHVPPPSNKTNKPGLLRREVWVIPLLVFSSLIMVVIAGFEVFVLCKAWRTTPSRRHLFLGQMLLLGLFLCAGLGAVMAATPTPATCGTVRFGTGVAYAIVFAALLVKCVFLISLNGGVYLPAPYQALLLLFAVLIQVAVGLQWLLNAPPKVDMLTLEDSLSTSVHHRLVVTAEDLTPYPLCHTPYTDILLSLLYVVCLILFVAVLAIKSRGIRDNYREATFIGLAVGCSIPIWLVWVLCGLLVHDRHRDACLAFGLVTTSTVVFLVMFMPKGRQLAAMGKEGVYVEDREERFSSLSPPGSGYSPSFFHFKPVKYSVPPPPPVAPVPTHKQQPTVTTIAGGIYVKPDDGNVYTTLEPTLSSNPNVFFQRSGVHPGMMY
ncbi:metabotropic glutamate receptor 3 isoform X2 [Anabrus simplex]|uniref:metabotropic glutamate receptor 3 isoform X2 n=1 Tax=Anabrus simplex TaxID=316456 RepID=UPI0034DDB8E4